MEKATTHSYYSVGFNDIPATELALRAHSGDIAAIQQSLPIDWESETVALLHAAIHGNNYEIVKLLIDNGAPIDSHSFYIAYHFQSKKMFQLLQHTKPDHTFETETINEILLDAARSGDVETVQWALDSGAEVNAKDYFHGFVGWTSLHHACQQCHLELVGILITRGANVHLLTDDAETPLMVCVTRSKSTISRAQRKDCVKILTKSGAQLGNQVGWLSRMLAKQGFRISSVSN